MSERAYGCFYTEELNLLRRVLELTTPKGVSPSEREARAATLFRLYESGIHTESGLVDALAGPADPIEENLRRRRIPETPYDPEEFSQKHGLSLKAAQVVILSNGPSRQRCDHGAEAFLAAVAARQKR
jgi:hypothetical protein